MTAAQQLKTATVTTPTDRTIHIERIFEAPRDRVYEAMTNPDLVPKWWGQPESETIVDKMDVVAGGQWRFVQKMEDGSEQGFRGTYREVTPPERTVTTWEWEGMPGHIIIETTELEDLGDRTKVTTTSLFHTNEERDGMLASGMEKGLNASYFQLDDLLADWDNR